MKDALGNEIVYNNCYGYSRNQNGITYVRVGKVVNETPKGYVTMEVETSKRALYNDELKEDVLQNKRITIKSNMLFPVNFQNEL